ncbi:phage portal protein [Paraburkholderia sp. J8-2]|uniref:phage portal protein n=1 Tax=Paraburkholderia sp. J8-2 TaxID=2805440 RepID=UPI002AB78A71|nr:phage portal protein [Paraburkholderia sp. J8-2]
MGFLSRFWRDVSAEAARFDPTFKRDDVVPLAAADGVPGAQTFDSMDDPRFLEYVRTGEMTGMNVDGVGFRSLRNMATLRCLTLISQTIGMLPVNLMTCDTARTIQEKNPAHRLMRYKPNAWQTPSEFKSLMQLRCMMDGQSFARIIRSMGRPIALVPLPRGYVAPRFNWATLQIEYVATNPQAGTEVLGPQDIFHLRDISIDGVNGISRIQLSREVLDLARHAERAASKTFETGVMAGGAIEVQGELSDEAYARMKTSIRENYSGSENAGDWMIVEGGGKANQFQTTAQSAQQIETRNHQIEEVARMWGVPRPLLMMSDTSWGAGIEQLAIFFIQYGLSHWFNSWEEASARSMLTEAQLGVYKYKFDETELLRGTLADQAAFFSKAMGAGGSAPWMTQNEVRERLDLSQSDDPQADLLRNPMTMKTQGVKTNEPAEAS